MPRLTPPFKALVVSASLLAGSADAGGASAASDRAVGSERTITTAPGDDLVMLARRHGVPFGLLTSANPDIDAFHPTPGSAVVLPQALLLPAELPDAAAGIVINLAELRLYHRRADASLAVYPIGIGRSGTETPLAHTVVTRVDSAPSWHPPTSIRTEYADHGLALPARVPPGPDNPLGSHAVRLALPGYLLHGTNAPEGVGLRVSHGCIRLYNRDIAELAATVTVGTPVSIVHRPIKWAIEADAVLLEAHRPLAGQRYDGASTVRESLDALRTALADAGLDADAFDAQLRRRHTDDTLFSGRRLRVPLPPAASPLR